MVIEVNLLLNYVSREARDPPIDELMWAVPSMLSHCIPRMILRLPFNSEIPIGSIDRHTLRWRICSYDGSEKICPSGFCCGN